MIRRLTLTVIVLIVAFVYLYTAAGGAILDDGDALYAHIAQQMARSGEWVTPYANGVRFLDKPPMMYWLMGGAYRIFGYNEFAARLPSALAVLGIGILAFLMTRRVSGHRTGVIAFSASALCIGTFLFTRMAFPDVLFVFFLTLSLWAFFEWYLSESDRVLPALMFYAAAAGAVLSKGLIGLVFPVAIIGLFLLWTRDLRRILQFRLSLGSLLFLGLALPWHVLAARRNPGFLWYYFINEQVLRFVGKRQPVDYESIALPVFWGLVLVWVFPWSAFIPAIRHAFKDSSEQDKPARSFVRLNASWIIVMLVFFSFSSRIEHYAMPVFPPLAMLVAFVLSPERSFGAGIEALRRRSISRSFGFLAIFGLSLVVVLGAGMIWAGRFIEGGGTGRLHAYKYYFAPLFDMPPEVLSTLAFPLVGTCIALAAGLTLAWWLNRRGARMPAVMALSMMMAVFCLFSFQSLGICEEMISSKRIGQRLNELYRSGDDAVIVGDFETANSMNFYAPALLKVYQGSAALLQWGLRYPDAPRILLSADQLEEKWKGPARVFLVAPEEGADGVDQLTPRYVLLRSGTRLLLSNQR